MDRDRVGERIAEALLHIGSDDYTVRSGPILTLMSEFAEEGELPDICRAYMAYVALIRDDGRKLADAVPAKVLNRYFYIHLQRSRSAVARWMEAAPDWSDRVKRGLSDPERFGKVVERMADEIEAD